MTYFSGFGFRDESPLFDDWLHRSDYTVAGFSYGAIRAFEQAWCSTKRIERLQLFSPAFFHGVDEAFIRSQLDTFRRSPELYFRRFYRNVASPAKMDLSPYRAEGSAEELERLLRYRWDARRLEALRERGTVIEVFLGERDRIVDAEGAIGFFAPLATATYRFRKGGHLLR
ncbi:pimelyl-ACP methyl ester esterase BioV [Nitratifractor sp.]